MHQGIQDHLALSEACACDQVSEQPYVLAPRSAADLFDDNTAVHTATLA